MNKLLVALGALSALSGCAGSMTPQQAQAWSDAAGQMQASMNRTQYRAQPVMAPSYTCRNYGKFTNCDPN
jgi:hypothetical protein